MKKCNLGRILQGSLLFFTVAMATGCDDIQVDLFGEVKVKVVNAASQSGTQEFFLTNQIVARDLDYAESTNSYVTVKSGNNLIARLTDQIDVRRFASCEIDLLKKDRYTIYLAEDGTYKCVQQQI